MGSGMKLLDILDVQCIRSPLQASDKQAAIFELVDLLAKSGRVTQPETLRDAVWAREQTRTTGIGHGLAIPHGKAPGVDSLAIAIGRPSQPMEFQAIDSKPVRLIILLASPPHATSDHIQALAGISKLMSMEEFRQKVYAAGSADEIFRLFREHESPS